MVYRSMAPVNAGAARRRFIRDGILKFLKSEGHASDDVLAMFCQVPLSEAVAARRSLRREKRICAGPVRMLPSGRRSVAWRAM
jgi:hypothetical protein